MAETPEALALTEAHRLLQLRVSSGILGDVLTAWPTLDPGNLDGSFAAYAERLLAVTTARNTVSATVAASYYDRIRAAEEVTGDYALTRATVRPDQVVTSLRVTGPVTWKSALARGASPARAQALAQAATTRSLTRHVLNGGRETVLRLVASDPEAYGYMRVSDGSPCAFCAMLIGRGPVYKKETAYFQAHDGCGCTAEPFFRASPTQRDTALFLRDLYDAATTGEDYKRRPAAFRRAYEALFPPGQSVQALAA